MRYRAELKDGTIFRNTEYIRLEGNKIREVEVYFGSLQGDNNHLPQCYKFAENKIPWSSLAQVIGCLCRQKGFGL